MQRALRASSNKLFRRHYDEKGYCLWSLKYQKCSDLQKSNDKELTEADANTSKVPESWRSSELEQEGLQDDQEWEDMDQEEPVKKKRRSHKATKTCSAINCSKSKWSHPHLSFFSFPAEEKRCKIWIQNVRREDILKKSVKYCHDNLRLCSDHFEDCQFMNAADTKRLVWNAVPHQFQVPNAVKKPKRRKKVARKKVFLSTQSCRQNAESESKPAQETHLKQKLRLAHHKVKHLKSTVKSKTRTIRNLQKKLEKTKKLDQVIRSMEPFLPPDMHKLVSLQMQMSQKKRKVYSDDFRSLAVGMYYKSPSCYRFLQSRFKLPCKATIKRWMNAVQFSEGLCPNLQRLLKIRVERLKKEDRFCTLMLDELSLRKSVDYDATQDIVMGLSRNDDNDDLAFDSGALVLLTSGLKGYWRQAFSFYFVKNAMSAEKLLHVITAALDSLEDAGLDVRVLCADQGSNFTALFGLLGVTIEKPYFVHRGKKIFCMADVPHLLKNTRNCLSKNTIETSTGTAEWSVITDFYEKDKSMSDARMAPKLTKKHFDLQAFGMKMKVKWASQVLSHTVSAGIATYAHFGQLGDNAKSTSKFVGQINNLFDVLNSSKKYAESKYKCALSNVQPDESVFKFLDDTYAWIKTWKIINKKGEEVTNHFRFTEGWLMDINAVKLLLDSLKKDNFEYLLTRRLTTDALENLFSIIRSGRGFEQNPGPMGFSQTFKHVVTN